MPSCASFVSFATLLAVRVTVVSAAELYSTNAICSQKNCINPVFPALDDLGRLSLLSWECRGQTEITSYLNFCKGVVDYNVSLPTGDDVSAQVATQENAAATMYFYHLAGMNFESWEYKNPATANSCVQEVWKLACYTYFPKSASGCSSGSSANYLRPCKSSCESYVSACGAECCDESIQCVFNHTVSLLGGGVTTQTGYFDAEAPSNFCTGSGAWGLGVGSALFATFLPLAFM